MWAPELHTAGANALNQYGEIVYPGTDPTAAPLHDADGNMKSGPLHAVAADGTPALYTGTLTWNAENRLVKVKNGTNTVAEFAYDYMGRRISKTVTPTTGDPVTTRFLYDGWNLIAEYAGTTLEKTYTWGMDLSGTMQGAGGVGGLLAANEIQFVEVDGETVMQTTPYYPTFDGNGNVSEYLDDSGDVVAHYEYDPFGNLTTQSYAGGFDITSFAHKFSTKYHDTETGLYYYGYRYLDPATGRWPSRDPIGEMGGLNLYGFVENDGVGQSDALGLFEVAEDFTPGAGPLYFANYFLFTYARIKCRCEGSITCCKDEDGKKVLKKIPVSKIAFSDYIHVNILNINDTEVIVINNELRNPILTSPGPGIWRMLEEDRLTNLLHERTKRSLALLKIFGCEESYSYLYTEAPQCHCVWDFPDVAMY